MIRSIVILIVTLFLYTTVFAQLNQPMPATIHIKKDKQPAMPKLDTTSVKLDTLSRSSKIDSTIYVQMIGHKSLGGFNITNKLSRTEMLNAGAITLRGREVLLPHPSRFISTAEGVYITKKLPPDTIKSNCIYTIVGFKMKFARRIVKNQLKKVWKIDNKKYYLIAKDGHFTDDMMNAIAEVPKGERILIYSMKGQRKDGTIKKLRRIVIKLT